MTFLTGMVPISSGSLSFIEGTSPKSLRLVGYMSGVSVGGGSSLRN